MTDTAAVFLHYFAVGVWGISFSCAPVSSRTVVVPSGWCQESMGNHSYKSRTHVCLVRVQSKRRISMLCHTVEGTHKMS